MRCCQCLQLIAEVDVVVPAIRMFVGKVGSMKTVLEIYQHDIVQGH